MRRTRLIATLGPASDSPAALDALIAAGLDIARINTSHAAPETLGIQLAAVRAAAARAGREVAVMLDLGGGKLRLGSVDEGTVLEAGQTFELRAVEGPGDAHGASVNHPGLARDLAEGNLLLVDDGRIELEVTTVETATVRTVVRTGGPLSSRKGINVPGVRLGVDGVTTRDLEILEWAIGAGVDLVAQSFVRSADDVHRLRDAMGERRVPIVAKIEKHEAVDDLDAIVEAADAVMVARGDLGVEIPVESVPVVQRRIVAAARAAGVPVIVATQMLESMTEARRPTRAEASDVANAIFDAVDAVMLSGETAIGRHPAHVLATMDRIVRAAEDAAVEHPWSPRPSAPDDVAAAVSRAACDLADGLDLAAIVTATQSGATARSVAAHRPKTAIVAATPDPATARRLMLVWGVRPVVVGTYETIDEMIAAACAAARDSGTARPGDLVAVTGGVAVNVAGSTNFVQVNRV
ncbi:MAG TPA: pyruvate kinase [Coriobacteriia bacterium]|nr:pyruvate kinase [Coriobacteriia bacterium]